MIEIKKASIIHINSLQKLFNQYRQFYQMEAESELTGRFLSQRLNNNDSIIYLAFDNQELVAFAQIFPSFSSVAMKPVWLLNDLFVEQKSRNRGIAKKLILTLQKEAKKNKIFSIKLATGTENLAAQSLYESLDFKLNDQFKFYSKRI